jgi:tripartite-type tricarboxylate transporter receptor subunit TctC
MIAGRVDVTCDNVSALLPHIKSGALRALAVTTPERLAVLPDVPTMDASGINVVVGSSPAELAKFVKDESDIWGPIIKEASIRIDG